MSYTALSKIFYQNKAAYEEAYKERFESEYAVHLDFDIKGSPAFFTPTPEIYKMLTDILRMNGTVSSLCRALPGAAIRQFSRRCLIDEIVLTNSIEGVRSTRKEISDILDELETKSKGKRFYGLVQKYNMLLNREELELKSCEDIREIYDELVLTEVEQEEPNNIPDGKWFRKEIVSIYSPSQKEIHRGLYPEEVIIETMERALEFLNDESCEILFRISVFHYLLEYIHPFYDGNGRLGRFICSYLLSRVAEPVTGYRLSYTIKENINEYYQAFTICNDPLNRGDLTPFLEMFLKIIKVSVEKLKESLQQGLVRLDHCLSKIPQLIEDGDGVLHDLYNLLIQASLFSEFGVPTNVVLNHIEISRGTLNDRLKKIKPELLKKVKIGSVNYYSLNLEQLEK